MNDGPPRSVGIASADLFVGDRSALEMGDTSEQSNYALWNLLSELGSGDEYSHWWMEIESWELDPWSNRTYVEVIVDAYEQVIELHETNNTYTEEIYFWEWEDC